MAGAIEHAWYLLKQEEDMGESPAGAEGMSFMDPNRLFVENANLKAQVGRLQMMLNETRTVLRSLTSTVASLLERGDVSRAIDMLRNENEIISNEMDRGMN
tara:strand:+ start:754 stop:1056 length:303 start_codon:yes stop_codon:yes gene_type:complete